MSPPPWTLFWPRSGLTPLPYRPTWPVSSTSEMRARTLSTALWCSVMPSVQQIIALSARREGVGQFADRLGRDARLALGVLERVRLDLGLVGLEAVGRAVDELAVLEAGRDDLARDRVRQRDVRPDVEAQPGIGPFRRRGPAGVDHVQARAVADALEQVVEEDRMRLAGVAAPQDDQVRLLGLMV